MTDPTIPEPAPTPAPAAAVPAKQGNPVGLAALIVGIIAFIFAVLPFLSFIAWLPAVAAIILGIIGLVQKGRKKATSAVGLALGVLAIIVGIIVTLASIAGVASSVQQTIDEDEADASEIVTLTYEVTSDAPTATNITYSTFTDGNDGTQQATDAALPWSQSIEVERGGDFDFNFYSLLAQASQGATTISCKITFDGQVLSEQTSTGEFAVVTCNGDSSDLD